MDTPNLNWCGAVVMHELHVIQGPTVTRDVPEKIAFFAFHVFVAIVEDSRSGPNYTTPAHAFVKAMLRLRLRAPFVARNNNNLIQVSNVFSTIKCANWGHCK